MKPGERQLWRVLNASAITYLNLAVLFAACRRSSASSRIDGVPMQFGGSPSPPVQWVEHIGVPPGARAEFIVDGPPAGVPRAAGDAHGRHRAGRRERSQPRAASRSRRWLTQPSRRRRCPRMPRRCRRPLRPWLGDVAPVRVRKLFFSEQLENPNDPNSPTRFFLTVDGQTPKPFDPHSDTADIVVSKAMSKTGSSRTARRSCMLSTSTSSISSCSTGPAAVNEPFLRDTVNVPYFNGRMLEYPSVRLRMDFRDPNIVGTFVYHCHLLEHEDGGMMGRIKVVPRRDFDFDDTIQPTDQRRALMRDKHKSRWLQGCRLPSASWRWVNSSPPLFSRTRSRAFPDSPVFPASPSRGGNEARTPIKHVIVIIGENRSFDHVFATYVPNRPGETVDNLLSKGIVKLDQNKNAIPGPNFAKAHQAAAHGHRSGRCVPAEPAAVEFPEQPVAGPAGWRRQGFLHHQSNAAARRSRL